MANRDELCEKCLLRLEVHIGIESRRGMLDGRAVGAGVFDCGIIATVLSGELLSIGGRIHHLARSGMACSNIATLRVASLASIIRLLLRSYIGPYEYLINLLCETVKDQICGYKLECARVDSNEAELILMTTDKLDGASSRYVYEVCDNGTPEWTGWLYVDADDGYMTADNNYCHGDNAETALEPEQKYTVYQIEAAERVRSFAAALGHMSARSVAALVRSGRVSDVGFDHDDIVRAHDIFGSIMGAAAVEPGDYDDLPDLIQADELDPEVPMHYAVGGSGASPIEKLFPDGTLYGLKSRMVAFGDAQMLSN
jgi:hypothetical protein